LDTLKTEAEIAKMMAATAKLSAETVKLNREARWHPVIVVGAVAGTILTVAKLLPTVPQ
jgi:hypothetical protein